MIACVAIWTLLQVETRATAQNNDNGLRPRVARRHAPGIQEIQRVNTIGYFEQKMTVCFPQESTIKLPRFLKTVRKRREKPAFHFGFPKKLVIFVLPFTGDVMLGFFVLGDVIFDFEGITELLIFLLADGEPVVCRALTLAELRVLS